MTTLTYSNDPQINSSTDTALSLPNVCLIRPPTFTTVSNVGLDAAPPIGLAYLAAALIESGYPTTAIDAVGEAIHQYTMIPEYTEKAMLHGLSNEEIIDLIPENTQVIGMATMFSIEWPFQKTLLEQIRVKFPEVLIVVGGEHVTSCPEFVLETCPAIDVCVLGEGEEIFLALLKAFTSGEKFDEVTGLCLRSEDKYIQTGKHKRIQNVDEIPEPAWHIFPLEPYIANAITHGTNLGRSMPIMASRGCPYACTFCSSASMWTQKWNVREPQKVIDEMKKYIKRYNVTNFDFYDLTAIIRKEWIIEFCQILIEEKLNVTWQLPSGTRSEAIDDEVCQALYKSGCRHMSYAPESGSDPELKRIKKKVNLTKMIDSMKAAHRAHIKIKCNFIYAMPGQTWEDVFNTFKFIGKLAWINAEDISAFPYSPYPGTELFQELIQEGKIQVDDEYFKALSGYSDFTKGTSYNDTFGPKLVGFLTTLTTLYFYSLVHLFHPKRILSTIHAYATKDTSTRLWLSYSHLVRRSNAFKKARKDNSKTVIIDQTFTPKAQVKS